MTKAQAEDRLNTKDQLNNPNPVTDNRTWLRHQADRESGLIDLMVLKGTFSIEEMANELSAIPTLKPKSLKQWEKRIRDHLEHLSTQQGDSRNQASGQGGHNLEIKETMKR